MTITIRGRHVVYLVVAALALLAAAFLAGCSAKAQEPFNDAAVSGHFSGPAVEGNMPDGFSNWASKCGPDGFRVFVLFHSDSPYGAITAVPDPACRTAPRPGPEPSAAGQ